MIKNMKKRIIIPSLVLAAVICSYFMPLKYKVEIYLKTNWAPFVVYPEEVSSNHQQNLYMQGLALAFGAHIGSAPNTDIKSSDSTKKMKLIYLKGYIKGLSSGGENHSEYYVNEANKAGIR